MAGKGAPRRISAELRARFNKAAEDAIKTAPPSLQRDFIVFHLSHPDIYALIVKFAREVKAAGFEKYSMASIVERLRWHYTVEKKNRKFAMRDAYCSRYARLVMKTCPDLNGLFHTAKLKTK